MNISVHFFTCDLAKNCSPSRTVICITSFWRYLEANELQSSDGNLYIFTIFADYYDYLKQVLKDYY